MGDNTPWFLIHPREEVPGTNAGMVQDLVHSGSLRSRECTAAFQAIDRQHFWPAEGGKLAYADMPLRTGRLHLSAPHIYAKALESLLPLKPGMSFLNVGSGTGYFNSIVSELIGPLATNHGIDIWPETVAHAGRCCRELGKQNIEFTLGNVYQLDVKWTMRYDRIYLGACANSRSKYLYRLLEVGGILIGPFQVGHAQQLRRVVRQSETHFSVEVLGSVQFASLIEPVPTALVPRASLAFSPPLRRGPSRRRVFAPPSAALPGGGTAGRAAGGGATQPRIEAGQRAGVQAPGLPGVPFAFSLWERPWTPERCWLYPASYRRTVAMGLLCRPRSLCLPSLPTEVWVKHIFPWCPKWWFEAPPAPAPSLTARKGTFGLDNSDDDGGATRTPSTSFGSAGAEVDMGPAAEGEPSAGVLFEVFGNGHRHAIGGGDDPDDVEPEEGPRMVVPLQVLELLAADVRRRRRREERDDHQAREDEAGIDSLGEEDDEEEAAEEVGGGHVMADPSRAARASDDEEMADAEEPEAEFDEDAEGSDMAIL